MVQLSDDLRFQNLPPEEIRERIRKSMDAVNWKHILIDHTTWYNQITRCKHDIYNMPIIATGNNSSRPKAICEIKKEIRSDETSPWMSGETYIYNKDYVHINICIYRPGDSESGRLNLLDSENKNIRYVISYICICNPITQAHFYSAKSLEELKLIFTGQLMGQNTNSPFRTVHSVAGTYEDKCLYTTTGSIFIKRSAPIIQLLTKASIHDLQKKEFLIKQMQELKLPKENEVACKLINENRYIIVKKENLDNFKETKSLSAYYPVITYEMCKDLLENIPRMDIDFGCFGLGSAGTGVLDLLSRSTFFSTYLLADFDYVESKNLRNQWYVRNDVGNYKTIASEAKLKARKESMAALNNFTVMSFKTKFQNVPLQNFNFKYAFSAFDSIEARLDFVKTLHDQKISVQYLIDTRYDDLTASVFVVDMNNQEQVDYYLNGLIEDKKAFDNKEEDFLVKTSDDFIQYLDENNCFTDRCSAIQRDIKRKLETSEDIFPCPSNCSNEKCIAMFKEAFDKYIKDKLRLYKKKEESSCVRQNFMDIYHVASAFVFDAIRQIESKEEKPFTHVDVTTDPLPKSLLIRK